MTKTEFEIFKFAAAELGRPYIWRGKGSFLWSPSGRVQAATRCFDCSGLVTNAFNEAGLGDHRMLHNAQTLYDKLKSADATMAEGRPLLAFWGKGPTKVSHVGILFSFYGTGLILEAAGGDETTLTPKPSAKVRLEIPHRQDLVGLRMFPETSRDL